MMTCIVGIFDKENDCTWIGGDSLGSNGYSKTLGAQAKVFRHDIFKNILMGSTTTFRHIDLLKYSEGLFDEIDLYKKTELDHKYMVTKFIPNLKKIFKEGFSSEKIEDIGANFILCASNKLFEIQSDYSVLEPLSGFCSVGCGEQFAMGSLSTTKNMDLPAKERLILALEAAEQFSCGVQRPFTILNSKNEETITIT